MLKPDKYTNINTCVIGLTARIISLLQVENNQGYKQLLDKFDKQAAYNFELAICFLFALGKLEYKDNRFNLKVKQVEKQEPAQTKLEEIERLFKQIQIFFPEELSKSYSDLVSFWKQIKLDRRKYSKE